jgi:hypothetical protein
MDGKWGQAAPLPGLIALNAGGSADVLSISCASAGNCAVGGPYTDSAGHQQAFVASQVKGSWNFATEIPGLAALNAGGWAAVFSVSCGSVGDCAAAGRYLDGARLSHAFVVNQVHGQWQTETDISGVTDGSRDAEVSGVSCGAAGSCSVAGLYRDPAFNYQAFVVTERNGLWGKAIEVPGTAALNKGNSAGTNAISCAAANRCTAAGSYQARKNAQYLRRPFVVSLS